MPISHNLVECDSFESIIYEKRPCKDMHGDVVDGLYNAWIWLNNPAQYNSYTTQMIKEVILAFRKASNERDVVCTVFTGVGDKAFCTGGNTKEYAEYYAGNPQEYMQYMRLFNDMVTAILHSDKPVICRVNGMRIAGGQEIGMACDFTISSDLARFGQAGPRHGSAPVGGSTDFLDLFIGIERAMQSATLCEHWSAYKALRLGLISEVVPVLEVDGAVVPNPMVVTDRWLDDMGRIVHGEMKTGQEKAEAKKLMANAEVDLAKLDRVVDAFCAKLLMTFPNCLLKTIEEMRKKKLERWDRNRESSRNWLGLNMMTEAKAGFQAFNEGPRNQREVDFVELRRRLANAEPWTEALQKAISPQFER